MPYGGWIRQAGHLQPCPLGSGTITITLPDGPCLIMPLPTGDLEAAFQATGAADITAYGAVPGGPAPESTAPDPSADQRPAYRSFGWARATGPDGTTTQAWLQTGESYDFTAAASIRAVEEALARSPSGASAPPRRLARTSPSRSPTPAGPTRSPHKHR